MTMSMTKRMYLAVGLVAIVVLAFSAVTLTSRLTSAQSPDATVASAACQQEDAADDAAESNVAEADTDAIENECGDQNEAEDSGAADTDDVQDEISEVGGIED